nr:hypothetical protein [Tanacetum cinerariifolium]
MSNSEDSTVTYTTALSLPNYVPGPEEPEQAPPSPVYIPCVPEPVYPEYILLEDDVFLAEEQPLPVAALPTTDSPGYILESNLDEDPKDDDDENREEDPTDYPAEHKDEEAEEEEEPSRDDADDEDKEKDEDDDDEEEEHPALADSIPPLPVLRVTAMISFRPQPPTLSFTNEDAERFLTMPIPPPSPPTPLSSPLPQIPSLLLPASPPILPIPLPVVSPPLQLLSFDRKADRPEVTLLPRKRLSIVHCPGYEAGESLVAAVAARPIEGHRADYGFVDYVEAEIRRRIAEDIGYGIRDTWIDLRDVAEEEALTTLEGVNTKVTELAVVQEQDTQDIYEVMEDTQGWQTEIFQRVEALGHLAMTLGEIRALQAREQARACAPEGAGSTCDANRTGDDSHTSGMGVRRTKRVTRECTYQDFMKCQPLYFKGTEGVVELTQWFERMEMVFQISNCLAKNQGTDLTRYNQRFQELSLLCVRTCPEESDRVERYIGGLTDLIYESVVTSKPKTMQEATEMATGLMDKKIYTYAERQAINKRKFEDTSRNNQGRQQPPKRQDVAMAYAAGSRNRQQYAGSRPLCPKCNFNQDGSCIPRCYKCNKIGHLARDCKSPTNANVANNRGARVYAVGNAGTNLDVNTITGTFFLNNCYASVLFDIGADRCFVSTAFSSQFDIAPTVLNHDYAVELADEMGSFDVIIGMDWLSRYQDVIVCVDKIVRIPWGRETLIFHGDGSNQEHETQFNIISCAKTQKYMQKGCQVFLAHVTTKEEEGKSEKKRLENVSIVRDFPEVFPEDLPGLPSTRQVVFQIDLIPGAAPAVRAPYQLAPSEMK